MEIKTIKTKESVLGKKPRRKVFKIILIIALAALVLFGIYAALDNAGYVKVLKLAVQLQNQQVADKQILAQLKKIILLPDDVTPNMALITDAATLRKSQPTFFANAVNGQRLIIYPDQAIIFDAKANKIIKVGPVQIAQTQPVNFAIYNSLKDDPTNAKTAEMEAIIKKAFNNATVTVKANSANFDYPQTLVIDLVGKNADIDRIAQAVGGKVSTLPAGEKKPAGADVLVIIGK